MRRGLAYAQRVRRRRAEASSSRSAAFVARLGAARERRLRRWPVSLPLAGSARTVPPIVLRPLVVNRPTFTTSVDLHLAPTWMTTVRHHRVSLAVRAGGLGREVASTYRWPQPAPRRPGMTPVRVGRGRRIETVPPPPGRPLARGQARTFDVETAARVAVAAMPMAVSAAKAPRALPAGRSDATDAPVGGPGHAIGSSVRREPPPPLTGGVPEREIERLAERVIGSIDRRIAAQRERLGRV